MRKSTFDEDFEIINNDSDWKSSNNNHIDKEPSSNWEREFEVLKTTTKIASDNDAWLKSFDDDKPKRNKARPDSLQTSSASFDASKYSGAKAISSDMLFGHDQNVSMIL